jgi:Fe-S cluster assembly protein SufB
MESPDWAKLDIPPIDYQDAYYYAAPKEKPKLGSLDEVDPEILRVYEKLGIPIEEQKLLAGVEGDVPQRKIAVDAVFDRSRSRPPSARSLSAPASSSARSGSAEGIPRSGPQMAGQGRADPRQLFRGAQCGGLLGRHVRLCARGRALPDGAQHLFPHQCRQYGPVRADFDRRRQGRYVSYLEGCTAPMRDENQLHAAVVELVALDDAEIKYSTVQNWYPGDANGLGGIYNFVTKRALCQGSNSKVSWTQVETGSAITWKYPSCVLAGENSVGEFYSVAVTNNRQQADTGTKMIHLGKGSRSTIVSKGISAGKLGQYLSRPRARRADGGGRAQLHPVRQCCWAPTAARTPCPISRCATRPRRSSMRRPRRKISDDQLFYAMQRGLDQEAAVALIVNGFAKEVLQQLPMEFAVEAQKLLGISLEGSVG